MHNYSMGNTIKKDIEESSNKLSENSDYSERVYKNFAVSKNNSLQFCKRKIKQNVYMYV